jgi:hypothetical protein
MVPAVEDLYVVTGVGQLSGDDRSRETGTDDGDPDGH